MKGHICFLGSSFNRQDSLIVMRQGRSLVESGYEVTYVVCDNLPEEEKYGIRIIGIGYNPTSRKDRIINNPKRLKKILENINADIYQISEPELMPFGFYLKRQHKVVMFNLREYYPVYLAKRVPKFFRKAYTRLLEKYFRYAVGRYDAILNCMPEMADYIRNIMPCKHFADVTNFPLVDHNFSLSYENYCKRGNVINYFGSIYTISCQYELLEAISNIPDVKYLLAGKFYSENYKNSLMKHPAWNEKVEFINGFPREELSNIINTGSIGNVMKDFNQTETPDGSYSILKIFETMEAAIPVLLSKVPLYEAMVEKYHCGLCVDPHNVQQIHDAIEYLISHKCEAYEMGQNGRKAVLEEYSWERQYVMYENVVKQLLNKK